MASDSKSSVSTTTTTANTDGVAKAPGIEGLLVNIIPFVLIFVVFYFLLIRPQKKKQTEHKKMIDAIKAGNVVLLNSGMKGTIIESKQDGYVVVEIAPNVSVEVLKTAIINIIK